MDFRGFLLFMTTFLLILNEHIVSADTCTEVASTVGTNFIFGVPAKRNINAGNIYVHITSMSNNPAYVRITAPFINYDRQLTVSNSTIVALNESLIQMEEGRQFKGIEVFSDWNISVSVLVYSDFSDMDGFLVLPTAALSTRYIAASYHPYSTYNNSILVVGAENNTNVSIKYKTTGSSLTFQNVTLQRFQTFQVLANYDLSGAVIISNRPIALLSGSHYSEIPVGIGGTNFIIEQMIPTRFWVTKFIVPPIFPHNYYVVRIFADDNNTEIHCYNHTHHFAVYLDQGSMHEVFSGSDPAVIVANKPISVMQYLADNENMNGDPFMTTVQGMSQFVNSYKFITESAWNSFSTLALALTITKDNWYELQLNRRNISSWNPITKPVAYPMDNYMTLFVNITQDTQDTMFEIRHIVGNNFGASLFGLFDEYTAYGYPLQLSLSAHDCLDERTTQRPEVTTEEFPTTYVYHTNPKENGTWCMECENMLHLQFCDKVTRCNTDEVCYVQATVGVHNPVFRTGCMLKSKCYNRDDLIMSTDCRECCESDFCNSVGCGDPGLPDLQHRGPMCFDCSHYGSDDTCGNVQMCRSAQVCKIEKYQWGNGYYYNTGCTDTSACKSRRNVNDLLQRSLVTCSHCCNTDYCNTNCTNHLFPDIIG